MAQWLKNLPANMGDAGDANLIPALGRSPGKGNGYLLQYSSLEKSMDGGAWRTTVQISWNERKVTMIT